MTTHGKPLPRFVRPGRGAGPDEVVRPIAPTLLRLAGETEPAKRHENLAQRYGESRTELVALATKLEQARRVDLAEQRAAAETGRKVKPPKAPRVEEQIEEAHREVQVLGELVEESADELLRAVVPLLPEAEQEASAAVELALSAAHDALIAARAAFERAATLAAEASWIAGLRRNGTASPWRSIRGQDPTPRAAPHVREAIVAFDDDRLRTAERVEQAAREREAEEALKLPVGATVWRKGQSFIVGEDGELVEDAEVG